MGQCVSTPEAKYSAPETQAAKAVQGTELLKATQAEVVIPVAEKEKPHPVAPAPAVAVCAPCAALKLPEPVTNPDSALIGNLLDPVNGPACGLPYQVHYLGPPLPPCEGERLATARALGRIDNEHEDPEITNILRLCSNIFNAPVSLCALFDDQRVFISEADGSMIPTGTFPWRWTLCGWSLAFKNPQILVIPDTLQDSRFANNLKCAATPHVRFYCGAPLVASNGHRLGTLCFADTKPRNFDQASCMIMNNLSELVVRQLEKGQALKAKTKDNTTLAASFGHLQRAFDAYEHCVVLLDVTQEGSWKVMYSNAVLQKMTGVDRNDAVGRLIEDLFEEGDGSALASRELRAAVAANKSYRVKAARTKKPSSSGTPKSFILTFRPAAKEHLDDSVMQIGVPAFLPVSGGSGGAGSQKLYFMTVDVAGASVLSRNASSKLSFALSSTASSAEMEGLDMGHLLGKGTFGSVYYGTWFGTPVAVKVIESDASKTAPLLEAVLSQQMKHPLIVSTLKYFHRSLKPVAVAPAAPRIGLNDSAYSPQSGGNASNCSSMMAHEAELGLMVKGTPLSVGTTPLSVGTTPLSVGTTPVAAAGSGDNSVGTNGWAVIDFGSGKCEGGGEDLEQGAAASGAMMTPATSEALKAGAADLLKGVGKEKAWRQTVLIMEYADRGSLQEALDRGWLCADRSEVRKGPNMEAVLATAAEVASALKYLHANSVVHGDLSGWNIMLSSSGSTAAVGGRNFVAKIADFGLARSLDVSTEFMTKNYGTLTHQPPETLTRGIVSRATDVYSFGVLLWQMYTGSRPWSGLSHAQVIMQVGSQGAALKWPPSTPPGFRSLAEACMHREVSVRPVFDDIVTHLESLQGEELAGAELSLDGEWS